MQSLLLTRSESSDCDRNRKYRGWSVVENEHLESSDLSRSPKVSCHISQSFYSYTWKTLTLANSVDWNDFLSQMLMNHINSHSLLFILRRLTKMSTQTSESNPSIDLDYLAEQESTIQVDNREVLNPPRRKRKRVQHPPPIDDEDPPSNSVPPPPLSPSQPGI